MLCIGIAGSALPQQGCSEHAAETDKVAALRQKAVLKWAGQLVRRAGNTPEDGKVYLVEGDHKRWVESGKWLELHGYNIVDDVTVIPANELAAIPTGADIR